MDYYDIAVIGAGPVGSNVAHVTAKKGLKTLLVEEHKSVGKPLHCAGLLYHKAIEEFSIPKDAVLNEIRGAHLYSPSGITLSLHKPYVDSYVVDREVMDLKLAERACDSGAVLLTDTKCYDIEKDQGEWTVKLRKKASKIECKAQITVDAEGWKALLAEKLGVKRKLTYLKGAQFELSNVNFQSKDHVELYFGKHFFPGFFGWIIPMSEDKAKVGLCITETLEASPFEFLEKVLKTHPILCEKTCKAKVERKYGGIIPIHGPIEKTYFKNFLIVGDSAGHVKSTTGGGMYFGLKASAVAGEVAVKCLESGNVETANFKAYEILWKKGFGKEIYLTSKMRKIADRLSDEDLDFLFSTILNNEKIIRQIEKYGDTAFQSKMLMPLAFKLGGILKRPEAIRFLAKAFLSF